jgi:hypothetical protein
MAEGWRGTDSATHQIAFAALPDNHTVIGLQHCRMNDYRGYVAQIKGMQFNLPNDLYNEYIRELITDAGKSTFTSPPLKEECISLSEKWANIENRIGLVGLYGAENLSIHRHPKRRAGSLQSLFVEEICYPGIIETKQFEANEMILDAGWAAISSVDTDATKYFYTAQQKELLGSDYENVRAVQIEALNKKIYYLIANFGEVEISIPVTIFCENAQLTNLASETAYSTTARKNIQLLPCQGMVLESTFT